MCVNQGEAAAEAAKQARTPRSKAKSAKVWSHNSKHDLDRAEFLQCLCRVAVARFVLSGKPRLCDVSDAIERLFEQMRAHAGAPVRQDSNLFRDAQCYTQETDAALRLHEPTLRLLFSRYSSEDGAMGGKRAESKRLLSCAEWVSLARDLGLVDDDLSVDDAKLLFIWSRTRVVDEDEHRSRPKVENLSFCDFLEAIVRCAHCKALPTDKQLARSGDADAHAFLERLKADRPAYLDFLAAADGEWDSAPRQPIARAVSHLLVLMVRGLEARLGRITRAAPKHAAPPSQIQCDALYGAAGPSAGDGGGGGSGDGGDGGGSSSDGGGGGEVGESSRAATRCDSSSASSHETFGAALDRQLELQGAAAKVISKCCRGALDRIHLRKRRRHAVVVQRAVRAYALRRRLRAWPRAARRIQACLRGWRTRVVLRAVLAQAHAHRMGLCLPAGKVEGWWLSPRKKGRATLQSRTMQAQGSQSAAAPFVVTWPQPKQSSFEIGRPTPEALLRATVERAASH